MEHLLPARFLTSKINVVVIGAGGTGSQMVTALARLNHALMAFGHPHGLNVLLVDDDTVSETNLLRQSFYPCDIGQYKAPVIINRVNAAFALDWTSCIARVTANSNLSNFHIVIGCVDTRAARKAIYQASNNNFIKYWLDCGNRLADGQIIFGELEKEFQRSKKPKQIRLPHAGDLYPEMLDASLDASDDIPSCSLAEALEKQSLFINTEVVTSAANLLFEFFRHGSISFHGNFFNLKTGKKMPLMVDPETWKRMGYTGKAKRKPRQH
mgnify:CR=1 FL=1